MYYGKIRGSVPRLYIAVIDRHEMRLRALVIEVAGQSRGLRHRRRREIRFQFAGELLLQALDQVPVEPRDPPENVDMIRRRVEDVIRARKVPTQIHAGEDRRTVRIGVQEHVSNRSDRIARPRATARRNGVHTNEDVVLSRVHHAQPSLKMFALNPGHGSHTLSYAPSLVRLQKYGNPIRGVE